MPKVKQRSLPSNERIRLIQSLNELGLKVWHQNWRKNMALPKSLPISERESVVRFLLLRALLNQQGDTEKVKKLVQELFSEFGKDLLHNPIMVERQFDRALKVFYRIGGKRGAEVYRIGALGGIKPLSLFLYRFAAFAFFLHCCNESLYGIAKSKLANGGVHTLWTFFRDDPILDGGWVGNDPKAARMLTNWLVWLFTEVWREVEVNLMETVMVVDGHVGKVFCRTGALEEIAYEAKRPFIIVAKDIRNPIEQLVKATPKAIPAFVDEAAFHVARSWCYDTDPKCNECPLHSLCLAGRGSSEHLRWTAYRATDRPITGHQAGEML